MNIEKEIKENYPLYPLIAKIPRKLSVRIGSRNFYVDVPFRVYQFMIMQVMKVTNGVEVTKESIKVEWMKLIQDYKDELTVNGKPIATVYLTYQPFAGSSFLILKIYWSRLIEYLELKAREVLNNLMSRGGDAAKEFYKKLWLNFFMIGGRIVVPHEEFITFQAEKVRRLLEVIGDYQELNEAVDKLIRAIDELSSLKKYVRSVEPYVASLAFHVQHLRKDVELVNSQQAFLHLRTILEHLVRLTVYLDAGIKLGSPDIILFFTYVNEYETKRYTYSIANFMKELHSKYKRTLRRCGRTGDAELLNKLEEMQVPRLMVSSRTVEEFADVYGLSTIKKELSNTYSACSWVVHNRPGLPYYSVLELKLLKLFMKRYVDLATEIVDLIVLMVTRYC